MADDEDTRKLAEAGPMVGGNGPHSYNQNSWYQKGVMDATKGMIKEGITDKLDFKNLSFDTSNTFRIADLGCSVGPNAFFAVENIVEAVELKYHDQLQNTPVLEFQVLFNDLVGKDFNTLFETLPSNRRYFAARVPGSFHRRIFPEASLHVVHSSRALHWLSKVPKEIVDGKSPAWNKGGIQCTEYVKEVSDAYAARFKNDMTAFLYARAEKLVGGGLLLISTTGLPKGVLRSQTDRGIMNDFLGLSLIDLAGLGMVSEEKVNSFNLPLYCTTTEELREIIEADGSFGIETICSHVHPVRQMRQGNRKVLSSLFRNSELFLKGSSRSISGTKALWMKHSNVSGRNLERIY